MNICLHALLCSCNLNRYGHWSKKAVSEQEKSGGESSHFPFTIFYNCDDLDNYNLDSGSVKCYCEIVYIFTHIFIKAALSSKNFIIKLHVSLHLNPIIVILSCKLNKDSF
jgi:hypothetical protein